MPIYAYKCANCGFAKDVLQKMSDAPLSVCPACGAAAFTKQVTAAGFQLKGSGWYVTDFRESAKPKDKPAAGAETASSAGAATPPAPSPVADATSAPATPAPAPSPATSSGGAKS